MVAVFLVLAMVVPLVHAQDVVVGSCTPSSSQSLMGRALSASDLPDSTGALRVASGATGANNDIGEVYVLGLEDCGWMTQDIVRPPDSAVSGVDAALFGSAVALQGDVLVVGAPGSTPGGTSDAGAVFVYTLNSTTDQWDFAQVLLGPGWFGWGFGFRLAFSPTGTLLVADRSDAGFVLVYEADMAGSDHTFFLRETWKSPNVPDGFGGFFPFFDHEPVLTGFGWSMAVQGDRAVVTVAGAAYVWERRRRSDILGGDDDLSTTSGLTTSYDFDPAGFAALPNPSKVPDPEFLWVHEVTLLSPLPEGLEESSPEYSSALSSFGASVALHDACVAIGAPLFPTHVTYPGVKTPSGGGVFVYCENATEVWRPVAALHSCLGSDDAGFGFSLALTGEVLAVGSPGTINSNGGFELDSVGTTSKRPSVYVYGVEPLTRPQDFPPVNASFSANRTQILAGTGPGPAFQIQHAVITAADLVSRVDSPLAPDATVHSSNTFGGALAVVHDAEEVAAGGGKSFTSVNLVVGGQQASAAALAPLDAVGAGECSAAFLQDGSCSDTALGAVFIVHEELVTGQSQVLDVCPTPSASPSPSTTPTPTPTPSNSPSTTASPTGTPSSTPTPSSTTTSTPTPSVSGTPTVSPSPSGTPTTTPSPSSSPTPSVSGTASPTPSPISTFAPPSTFAVESAEEDPVGWGSLVEVAGDTTITFSLTLDLADGRGVAAFSRRVAVVLRHSVAAALAAAGVTPFAVVVQGREVAPERRGRALAATQFSVTMAATVDGDVQGQVGATHLRSDAGGAGLQSNIGGRLLGAAVEVQGDTLEVVGPSPTPSPSNIPVSGQAVDPDGGAVADAGVIGIAVVCSLVVAVLVVVLGLHLARTVKKTTPTLRRFDSATTVSSSTGLTGRGFRQATATARAPVSLSLPWAATEETPEERRRAAMGFAMVPQTSLGEATP